MFKRFAVSFALVLSATTPALATTITPGSTVVPSSLSAAGLTVVSPIISGTISPGTFSATYQTGVASDTNNIYCSGCLDFLYAISSSGPGVIERVTMFDFDSLMTNVGYFQRSAGDVKPVEADRTSTGGVVGFNFDTTGLTTGQTSSVFVIQTNATAYKAGLFSIQDGSAGTGAAYAPTSATPEPASLFLFGAGLLGLGTLRRKMFKRQ